MLSLISNRSCLVVLSCGFLLSCSQTRPKPPEQIGAQTTPSPTSATVTTTDAGTFLIRHFSDEPLAIVNGTISTKNKRAVTLEVRNISNVAVKVLDCGLSYDERCAEYMYSFVPGAHISYGNGPDDVPVAPNNTVTIVSPLDKTLAPYFDSKRYSSCPRDARKPILSVGNVEYIDGKIWRPKVSIAGGSR